MLHQHQHVFDAKPMLASQLVSPAAARQQAWRDACGPQRHTTLELVAPLTLFDFLTGRRRQRLVRMEGIRSSQARLFLPQKL